MDLFQLINFKSHSGLDLTWKIEMDALSDNEWRVIEKMIIERSPPFRKAIGIPTGGIKLGNLLNKHATGKEEDPICIVDDVLTTGKSMECFLAQHNYDSSKVIGWVVFARRICPSWVTALFQMPV